MSDSRPNVSPYAYCQNNPVVRIDPNGALDDGFTLDESGNIERVDKTGGDKFDVIYRKEDYENGKRSYNNVGDKGNGIKVDKSFMNSEKNISTQKDGSQTSYYNASKFKNSEDLYSFLTSGSDAEWGKALFCNDKKQATYLITSHDVEVVAGPNKIKGLGKGWQLDIFAHSHVNNDNSPSTGDIEGAAKFPNAQFFIYTPATKQYFPFDSNSPSYLLKTFDFIPK